jgi:hypothetical protein
VTKTKHEILVQHRGHPAALTFVYEACRTVFVDFYWAHPFLWREASIVLIAPGAPSAPHPQAAAITASLDLIGTRKTARPFHVSLPAVNRHKQHVREEREAQKQCGSRYQGCRC